MFYWTIFLRQSLQSHKFSISQWDVCTCEQMLWPTLHEQTVVLGWKGTISRIWSFFSFITDGSVFFQFLCKENSPRNFVAYQTAFWQIPVWLWFSCIVLLDCPKQRQTIWSDTDEPWHWSSHFYFWVFFWLPFMTLFSLSSASSSSRFMEFVCRP